jgi:DEAD/DEAH box helicase domain-containing protein
VDATGFIDALRNQEGIDASVVHVETLQARGPVVEPFPGDLPPILRERLALLGIDGLYPHQRSALDLLRRGANVVIATGTASGKTLVYNLAFASLALADEKRTALYVFPTKALARDQLRQVRELRVPQVRAAVYDGDTPQEERPLIRRNANVVMTNPDMLHRSILPGHQRWGDFLLRLSLVVVDEAHVARGVFGSHVAMVLRRLRRLVEHYGGSPRFVLASATIGNPAELAERLVGQAFSAVTDDASPRGEKLVVLWNPPLVDEELGLRRSAVTETSWLLRRLVEQDVRTIAFCRTRRSAELVAEFARRELPSGLKRRVKAYRAGFLPSERRELERQLASGELLGVAATNALELGIDIGSLDAALLAGYPGTRASFWQQAGRAGRRAGPALAVLVAQDDPLDQYLVNHPDDLLRKPPEDAVIDPENPYVVAPHVACAAREQPLRAEEVATFGAAGELAVQHMVDGGELAWQRGLLHHRGRASPHSKVDIRSASGALYAIVDEETGALLGTVDEGRAFHHVHPGAVYLHQGEQYEVSELLLDRPVALVKRSDADYYTQPRHTTELQVLDELDVREQGDVTTVFGDVRVTTQVVGFARKSSMTQDVLDLVELNLPAQTLTTRAVWWLLPQPVLDRGRITAAMVPGSAHAAEHAAIGLLPLVATCDRWDIGGLSTASHQDTGAATIFVYDGYPGGAGIAERGYRSERRLLEATFDAVRECPCPHGCPSCVQSPKCGNGNEPLDKPGAVALLASMLGRAWG